MSTPGSFPPFVPSSLVGLRRWRNRIASKGVLLFPVRREVGHPKQGGRPSSEGRQIELSGCPARVRQAADQTPDAVSGLPSIQSAGRRGSRSVAVQHRLGAFDYSPAAGLILCPANQIESGQPARPARYQLQGAVSEMHRGYGVLRAPVRDGPSRHRFSGGS